MGELKTRQFAGIDLGSGSCQLSIYDEASGEMREESFPAEPGAQEGVEQGLRRAESYLKENGMDWDAFSGVNVTLAEATRENRAAVEAYMKERLSGGREAAILTRFRAFVEYVFHQERIVWDRNTMLLDYSGDTLSCVLVEQIRASRQKAYQAELRRIDLGELGITADAEELDFKFSRLMKQFLAKNPAHIIFLTGNGFEGNWMKRTLTYLCSGRRVFLGENIYANGACLACTRSISLMDEGMLLMKGPDMVTHTIGVITKEAGRAQYVPITSIGREWYNTKGSLDIILDKSQKVEFFYHNAVENEIECSVCEVTDLPKRPPKTTRIRIGVRFTGVTEGVILLEDKGFGRMYPASGKVTVFPFTLIP